MPDLAAFIRAIRENPTEDGPRLQYADWLEEQGESAAAELIRLGCELAAVERALPPLLTAESITLHLDREFTAVITRLDVVRSGIGTDSVFDIRPAANLTRDGSLWLFGCRARDVETNMPHLDMVDIAGTCDHFTFELSNDFEPEPRRTVRRIRDRINHLQDYHTEAELYSLPEEDDDFSYCTIDRGLVVGLRCSWAYWRDHGDTVLAVQPVAKVKLTTRPDYIDYRVGDIVTRDGTDRHEIIEYEPDDGAMLVRCTVAPETGWTSVGEEESNLPRRYELVSRNGVEFTLPPPRFWTNYATRTIRVTGPQPVRIAGGEGEAQIAEIRAHNVGVRDEVIRVSMSRSSREHIITQEAYIPVACGWSSEQQHHLGPDDVVILQTLYGGDLQVSINMRYRLPYSGVSLTFAAPPDEHTSTRLAEADEYPPVDSAPLFHSNADAGDD